MTPELCAGIKLLALDVDGVLTDGRVTYSSDGAELKSFNIKDGVGIKLIQSAGVEVVLITGRTSPMVERRAHELGIGAIIQGREDKLVALSELCEQRQLALASSAYMGDDLPDLAAIQAAGLGLSPADAAIEVREAADWCASLPGGHGAVREACEAILDARGERRQLIQRCYGKQSFN
ncbi:MAG: HAD hydrolase family protein [Pseudomonadota bacterium]